MGSGTEAGAIRQERPRRLRCHITSWLFATWLSLDGRRSRTLVIRTLLADALFRLPASAEGTAAGEVERRACPCFSGLTTTTTAAAYDDVPDVSDACCPDTTDAESDTATAADSHSTNPAPLLVVHVVHVGVVARAGPATAQFDVVALVIVVVLAAVAAMAASEEQQSPSVFLLGGRRVDASHTHTHTFPFSLAHPPALTSFFLLFSILSFFVALASCSSSQPYFLFFFDVLFLLPSFRLSFFSSHPLHSYQDLAHAHAHVPPPSIVNLHYYVIVLKTTDRQNREQHFLMSAVLNVHGIPLHTHYP
jgi:hypothetical protein